MKRLFLFAAYDKDNAIGPALLYYIQKLSEHGDIILFMDNALPISSEIQKISNHVKLFGAEKHGEYDFGSYKRAYSLAELNINLADYDFCYLLNDSVYGPLYNLRDYLERMEALNSNAFGMVFNPNGRKSHLQSWFIGLKKEVFLCNCFKSFINSVQAEKSKIDVCIKYETGLTEFFHKQQFSIKALYNIKGKGIYNDVKNLYDIGLPFIKKNSFIRHNGSLCMQIQYVLNKCNADARNAIIEDATRLWGKEYVEKILMAKRIDSIFLYIEYLKTKLIH